MRLCERYRSSSSRHCGDSPGIDLFKTQVGMGRNLRWRWKLFWNSEFGKRVSGVVLREIEAIFSSNQSCLSSIRFTKSCMDLCGEHWLYGHHCR
jgi:hypothetical protein